MKYNRIEIRHVCHISQKYTQSEILEKDPKYVKYRYCVEIHLNICCFSTALMKLCSITYIRIYTVLNDFIYINDSVERSLLLLVIHGLL